MSSPSLLTLDRPSTFALTVESDESERGRLAGHRIRFRTRRGYFCRVGEVARVAGQDPRVLTWVSPFQLTQTRLFGPCRFRS